MAAMNLNVPFVIRGLDSNGDAEAGSKLYVFEQGTTTPVTTYSDLAMTTPNAHPVVADSSGSWGPIYLEYGTYKIDVTDAADVSLPGYPLDDWSLVPVAGFTLTDFTFDNTGTGLAATDAQAALVELDLRDQWLIEVETAGSGNAYTLDAFGTNTAYGDGDIFVFRADRNNTGAATLNIDSIGAKSIKFHNGTSYVDAVAGEITDGNHYWVEYDSASDEFHVIFKEWRRATQAEAEAGTAVGLAMDPLRVSQAIAALSSGGSGFGNALLHVRDEKASGTNGGTFTSGAWQTRTLNTTLTNEISGASLAANQITLPAGTYFVIITAPGFDVQDHRAKLRNITDTADGLYGTSESDGSGQSASVIKGRFTIAASKVFELQHRCSFTIATVGFGNASGFGINEVYSEALIWKVG